MQTIFNTILERRVFSNFLTYFYLSSQKFGQLAICFFLCLFWVAGGKIDFLKQ
jgi:hypothetical protein